MRARFRRELARRFGVDVRALAALRIGLGALLLLDLAVRAQHLVAFYTDAGVLPRAVLRERYPAFASVSLHAAVGSAPGEAALFAVAGAAALALLAGYRTRLALLVSWLLLCSLHARNPLVLNGGDGLLRRLLFFGLFLPLGARWSLDAAARDGRAAADRWVSGVAAAALLVQVTLMYIVNGLLKFRGEHWVEGTAVRQVFSLEQFLVGLGPTLANYPRLLELFAHVWLALLVLSPGLLLFTGRARAALAGALAAMHLGMAATMMLGLFPFVSIVALLPFFPPAVWDAVDEHAPRLPAAKSLAGRLPTGGLSLPGAGRVGTAVAAVALVALLVWNAAALGVVPTPDAVPDSAEPTDRTWDMFAPDPMTADGWWVVPGTLDSGARVDAFRGGPVDWAKPPDVSASYPGWRWRKYLADLRRSDSPALAHAFAAHLCDRWTARHDSRLTHVTPVYVRQETRLDGPEPTSRHRLVAHDCGGSEV